MFIKKIADTFLPVFSSPEEKKKFTILKDQYPLLASIEQVVLPLLAAATTGDKRAEHIVELAERILEEGKDFPFCQLAAVCHDAPSFYY